MKALLILLGVLVSLTASAQNWTRTAGPVEDDVLDLCIDSNGILYAVTPLGVNRSTNGGEHWTRPFLFPLRADTTRILIAHNGAIILSSSSGIFVSDNKADTFHLRLPGVSWPPTDFALSGSGRLFAVNRKYFLVSNDHGTTWKFDSGVWKGVSPKGIAASRDTVITHAGNAYEMFCSFDNGYTWRSQKGLNPAFLKTMSIHPDGSWYGFFTTALYRNEDHGDSWDFLWYTGLTPIADIMYNGDIFVCSNEGLQLLRDSTSTDVSSDFDVTPPNKFVTVTRVVQDPRTGMYYAATKESGVWKSTFPLSASEPEHVHTILRITPNPAQEHITIEYTSSEAAMASIELRDLLGRVQKRHTLNCTSGVTTINLNTNELLPGNYLLILRTKDRTESQWVTIVK